MYTQVLFFPEFECEVCGHSCPMSNTTERYIRERNCFEVRCPECDTVHDFPAAETPAAASSPWHDQRATSSDDEAPPSVAEDGAALRYHPSRLCAPPSGYADSRVAPRLPVEPCSFLRIYLYNHISSLLIL
jgi:hypothetical protein